MIRELKEEIEALRKGGAVAATGGGGGGGNDGGATEEMERKIQEQADMMA